MSGTVQWTPTEIAALILERIDDLDEAATWVAVILAESGGNPVAYNLVDENPAAQAYLSTDNGLFQTNSYWHGTRLPVHEANRPTLAWAYWWGNATGNGTHPSDWTPWVAYKNGAYLGEREGPEIGTVEAARLDTAYNAVLSYTSTGDETVTRYPYGYSTGTMTMAELRARYEPKMHPEFARRLFPWLESMRGLIGIGGGWRNTQPDKPGFAPDGKSFHQTQEWASGVKAYAAVDLVARNGTKVHRSPTWEESETGPAFGLHTFIKSPPEPWHMQPIETRGWQGWVNAGRPDPDPGFRLPTDTPDPIEPPTEDEEIMTTVLIKPKAAYFGGGVFTVDGHPVSPEALAALKAAGPVVVIEQDHPWWDAATWDRLGSDGRRRYVELANG